MLPERLIKYFLCMPRSRAIDLCTTDNSCANQNSQPAAGHPPAFMQHVPLAAVVSK